MTRGFIFGQSNNGLRNKIRQDCFFYNILTIPTNSRIFTTLFDVFFKQVSFFKVLMYFLCPDVTRGATCSGIGMNQV